MHFSRYTCAILSAAWYLLRLGIFERPGIVKQTKYVEKSPFTGENIITVIPDKWKETDEKAKVILEESDYSDALENIECVYFSSDKSNYPEVMERIPGLVE